MDGFFKIFRCSCIVASVAFKNGSGNLGNSAKKMSVIIFYWALLTQAQRVRTAFARWVGRPNFLPSPK